MRLLRLNRDEIEELIESYGKSAKALREETLKMCWHMRGSISYDEAMQLSLDDRNIIAEIVKNNMEATKKSGLPFI